MAERQSYRHYSIHKRACGITPAEKLEKKVIYNDILQLLVAIEEVGNLIDDDVDNAEDADDLAAFENALLDHCEVLLARLNVLTIYVDIQMPPIEPRNLTLAAINPTSCFIDYRFTHSELTRLIGVAGVNGNYNFNGLLGLPRFLTCSNRSRVSGDTAFLYLVRKHVIYSRLTTDAANTVGRDYTQCSRIFLAASKWLYDTWSWRVLDQRQFTEFWAPMLPYWNSLIRQKYLSTYQDPIPARYERVAMFYDCNFFGTCEPVDPVMENAIHSHYEKMHGVKVGCLTGAGGCCLHLSTMYGGRHNDVFIQDNSAINNIIRHSQIGQDIQYIAYEDKAFNDKSHMRAKFNNRFYPIEYWQEIINENMDTLLCTVEWKFGRNHSYFGLNNDWRRMKLGESPIEIRITNQYLLDNLLICCRGANNLQYFDFQNFAGVPTLENYLQFRYVD